MKPIDNISKAWKKASVFLSFGFAAAVEIWGQLGKEEQISILQEAGVSPSRIVSVLFLIVLASRLFKFVNTKDDTE